jgi:D-glycero-alpha-D-manno-heptose-7-phosphate kinase
VSARAWCRVDLAGGTLDIWPLGLLHPGAVTVNVAVDLAVRVSVAPAERFRVEQGGSALEAADAAELARQPEGALVGTLLSVLGSPPLAVRVESASPRGGGLGASSALAVALAAAAAAAAGREAPAAPELVALCRDVEARLMGLPTGVQDHWPAVLGGALAVDHRPGGTGVRRLAADLDALAASLVVVYTGVSHFSAGQNWQVVRRRLDGDTEVTGLFAGIARVAAAAEAALAAGDLPRLGELVAEEWSLRRRLAPGISVPAVEALLAAALGAGAWGGKACGAGGGGCVAVLCPPGARAAVEAAMTAAGGELLALRPTAEPLEVTRLE